MNEEGSNWGSGCNLLVTTLITRVTHCDIVCICTSRSRGIGTREEKEYVRRFHGPWFALMVELSQGQPSTTTTDKNTFHIWMNVNVTALASKRSVGIKGRFGESRVRGPDGSEACSYDG